MDSMLEPIAKLRRDERVKAATLTRSEARYLLDSYFSMQTDRVAFNNQVIALAKNGEPNDLLRFMHTQCETLENQMASSLKLFAESNEASRWAMSIDGIGPILSAALLAYLDIAQAPTVGHWWAFAGLDPTRKWLKGQKRPWNARLKRLMWQLGECFTRVSGKETALYGQIYKARKALEIERNEAGLFADQAAESLASKNFRDGTAARKAYEAGKLPDARIHLRAQRYAVKLFLSHYHHVSHVITYHTPPPKPFVLQHCGHVHFIGVPNWPMRE